MCRHSHCALVISACWHALFCLLCLGAKMTDDAERAHAITWDAAVKWARNNPEWVSVKDRLPKPYHIVLTYHESDSYPIVAFMEGICREGAEIIEPRWLAEREGSEDDNYELIRPLLRPPTHWMELPHFVRAFSDALVKCHAEKLNRMCFRWQYD